MTYHKPVLFEESIKAMAIKPKGVYIDATFGGGGHSKGILKELDADGKLYGLDQDQDAWENRLDDERFKLIQTNFRHVKSALRVEGVREVDGILADLGVSSHQLDVAERGFSFRFKAKLDMRMNQEMELDAAKLLNSYRRDELQDVFSKFGEVRNSKTLATAIVEARSMKEIDSIEAFLDVIEPCVRGNKAKYLAQVFQAIRIEVNDEMEALKAFLLESLEILKPGGTLVVIAYHSLEDRLVKNFFKTGNFDGEQEKDFYGNIFRPFTLSFKKAVEPGKKEVIENSRSRSAKLRAAIKKGTTGNN